MFQNFKDCLLNNNVYRSQQRFKSYNHDVYTEEVNKIALNSNDDKRYKHLIVLQHIDMEQMLLKYVKVKMLEVKITIKYSITTTNIKNDQL